MSSHPSKPLQPFNHLTDSTNHRSLRLRLGLAQTGDPVAIFPLAAFLEQFGAFETLEHIPFSAESGRCAQTAML